MLLKFKKLDERAIIPRYASEEAAGLDLHVLLDKPYIMKENERYMFPTGLSVEIPKGYVGLVFIRSSVGTKMGVRLANGVGVIDSDYRGELMIATHNISGGEVKFESGDRLAQMVIVSAPQFEVEEVEMLSGTERGEGGFGSTGK